MVSNRVRKGELVALLTLKGELVAVGRSLMDYNEVLEASRGIVVEPVRVVLEPGLYPRGWKRGEQGRAP
jgi:H/ACA ribonucleoprotein complex subunit 4